MTAAITIITIPLALSIMGYGVECRDGFSLVCGLALAGWSALVIAGAFA